MSGLALEVLTTGYVLRPVTEAELPALLALCRSNPQYYRHCPPQPSLEGLARDLAALPPGKTAEDKYYLGYFDDARLIAALDLITGYPSPDTAFIGFFMLDASAQGCGLGSRLVSELFDGLAAQGFPHLLKHRPERLSALVGALDLMPQLIDLILTPSGMGAGCSLFHFPSLRYQTILTPHSMHTPSRGYARAQISFPDLFC